MTRESPGFFRQIGIPRCAWGHRYRDKRDVTRGKSPFSSPPLRVRCVKPLKPSSLHSVDCLVRKIHSGYSSGRLLWTTFSNFLERLEICRAAKMITASEANAITPQVIKIHIPQEYLYVRNPNRKRPITDRMHHLISDFLR